jgi:hypothetical protein
LGGPRLRAMVEGEAMKQEDIYSLSEWYQFESTEEGTTVALFAILKELKQLNKTLKEKNNGTNT